MHLISGSSMRVRLPWIQCRNLRATSGSHHSQFKILFLGRDEFSCTVLQQLYSASDIWDDITLVTQPDVKTGRRGSQISVSPLKILGQSLDLPVYTIPHDKVAFRGWQAPPPFLRQHESPSPPTSQPPAHHLLITASFGRILSNATLSHFQPSRRLNVHPSLLPKYRGAAPIQYALMDGQKETGVSVIEMTEFKKGIDSGNIWGTTHVPIPEGISFAPLRDVLAVEGGKLLVSVLRNMLVGKATATPQAADPNAVRAPSVKADTALINFTTLSADRIVCIYRAISHQKPPFVYLKTGKTLQLHDPVIASPTEFSSLLPMLSAPGIAMYHPSSSSLIVRCASNTFLSIPQVKQQDRAMLNAKEWWNGVRPAMRVSGSDEGPIQFLADVSTS